jgi:hypothetical protein
MTGWAILLILGGIRASPISVSFHLQHELQAASCERDVLTRSHVLSKYVAASCS